MSQSQNESSVKLAQDLLETIEAFRKSGWHRKMHESAELSPGEAMVLHFIAKYQWEHGEDDPGITPKKLGEKLHIGPSTITQHLGNIEEKGYILREMDKNDRRVIRVNLTEKGIEEMKRMKKEIVKVFTGLIENLGEEKSRELISLLQASSRYFNTLMH